MATKATARQESDVYGEAQDWIDITIDGAELNYDSGTIRLRGVKPINLPDLKIYDPLVMAGFDPGLVNQKVDDFLESLCAGQLAFSLSKRIKRVG